jgi:hypothetical protein
MDNRITEALNNSNGTTACVRKTAMMMKSRPGVVNKISEWISAQNDMPHTCDVWDYFHAMCNAYEVPLRVVISTVENA